MRRLCIGIAACRELSLHLATVGGRMSLRAYTLDNRPGGYMFIRLSLANNFSLIIEIV